jgi:hypothetical protein
MVGHRSVLSSFGNQRLAAGIMEQGIERTGLYLAEHPDCVKDDVRPTRLARPEGVISSSSLTSLGFRGNPMREPTHERSYDCAAHPRSSPQSATKGASGSPLGAWRCLGHAKHDLAV